MLKRERSERFHFLVYLENRSLLSPTFNAASFTRIRITRIFFYKKLLIRNSDSQIARTLRKSKHFFFILTYFLYHITRKVLE